MHQFCKLAESDFGIKIKDLSGDGIFQYQNYLKKVVGIDFGKLNDEWSEITKYNKLRNLLVHTPTMVLENTEVNKAKINILKSIPSLKNEESNGIIEFQILDKTVLQNFSKIISKFLQEIYYE